MVASSRRNSDATTESPSVSLNLSREVASGVVNMGNTCYMSAVLSALAHAPELCNAMDAEPHSVSCSTARKKRSSPTPPSPPASSGVRRSSRRSSPASSDDGDNFCTLCEVEQHLHRVHTSTDGPVAPSVFVHGFIDHVAPPTFKLGVQEDSHEFLRLLIDAMQKSCSRSRPDGHSEVKKEERENDEGNEDKENLREEDADDTDREYPFKLFRGTVDSNVMCDSCMASSSKIDPIEDIGLEVEVNGSNGQLTSLADSLQRFTQPEPLIGYKCDKCGETGRATKVSRLASVPPILTLHLKRFRYGAAGATEGRGTRTAAAAGHGGGSYSVMTGGSGTTSSRRSAAREVSQLLMGSSGSAKIEGHVKFVEVLNLKPYLAPKLSAQHTGSMCCRLFAVIVHAGKNSHSGHYIAFVRNVQRNEWWKMDDARVTPSSSAEVLSAEAYMLFYRVVDHPVAQRYRQLADRARDTAARQQATDDDDFGDAGVQEKKEGQPESRKRRDPPDPHYEDLQDWARRKTRIPPSMREIFPLAEERICKTVELAPAFRKILKEEAQRTGKKSFPNSIRYNDVLGGYERLKSSAVRMAFMLAKSIKASSSEPKASLVRALLGDTAKTDLQTVPATLPMVESDNVL